MDQSKCQLIQWFASRIIFNEAAFSLNQKGFYNPQSRSYWIFIGVTNTSIPLLSKQQKFGSKVPGPDVINIAKLRF